MGRAARKAVGAERGRARIQRRETAAKNARATTSRKKTVRRGRIALRKRKTARNPASGPVGHRGLNAVRTASSTVNVDAPQRRRVRARRLQFVSAGTTSQGTARAESVPQKHPTSSRASRVFRTHKETRCQTTSFRTKATSGLTNKVSDFYFNRRWFSAIFDSRTSWCSMTGLGAAVEPPRVLKRRKRQRHAALSRFQSFRPAPPRLGTGAGKWHRKQAEQAMIIFQVNSSVSITLRLLHVTHRRAGSDRHGGRHGAGGHHSRIHLLNSAPLPTEGYVLSRRQTASRVPERPYKW